MSGYHRVAVALDLGSESEQLIGQARRICHEDTELYLLYSGQELSARHYEVLAELLPESPAALASRVRAQDRTRLRDLGLLFSVPVDRQRLLEGKPAEAIAQFVEQHRIELLILGNHQRSYLDQWSHPLTDRLRRSSQCHLLLVNLHDTDPATAP